MGEVRDGTGWGMLACRKEGFIMIFWIFRGSTETIRRNSVSVHVYMSLIWKQPVVSLHPSLVSQVGMFVCMEDSFSWICFRLSFLFCSFIPLGLRCSVPGFCLTLAGVCKWALCVIVG